jgi:hypothetical protein
MLPFQTRLGKRNHGPHGCVPGGQIRPASFNRSPFVQEMLRSGCVNLISDLSATSTVEGILYSIVPPGFVPHMDDSEGPAANACRMRFGRARGRRRTASGGYHRDILRALAQRVEVDAPKELSGCPFSQRQIDFFQFSLREMGETWSFPCK